MAATSFLAASLSASDFRILGASGIEGDGQGFIDGLQEQTTNYVGGGGKLPVGIGVGAGVLTGSGFVSDAAGDGAGVSVDFALEGRPRRLAGAPGVAAFLAARGRPRPAFFATGTVSGTGAASFAGALPSPMESAETKASGLAIM